MVDNVSLQGLTPASAPSTKFGLSPDPTRLPEEHRGPSTDTLAIAGTVVAAGVGGVILHKNTEGGLPGLVKRIFGKAENAKGTGGSTTTNGAGNAAGDGAEAAGKLTGKTKVTKEQRQQAAELVKKAEKDGHLVNPNPGYDHPIIGDLRDAENIQDVINVLKTHNLGKGKHSIDKEIMDIYGLKENVIQKGAKYNADNHGELEMVLTTNKRHHNIIGREGRQYTDAEGKVIDGSNATRQFYMDKGKVFDPKAKLSGHSFTGSQRTDVLSEMKKADIKPKELGITSSMSDGEMLHRVILHLSDTKKISASDQQALLKILKDKGGLEVTPPTSYAAQVGTDVGASTNVSSIIHTTKTDKHGTIAQVIPEVKDASGNVILESSAVMHVHPAEARKLRK